MTDPDPATMTNIPKKSTNDFQTKVSHGKALRVEANLEGEGTGDYDVAFSDGGGYNSRVIYTLEPTG